MKQEPVLFIGLTVGVLVALSANLIAGQVALPHTFAANTPAVASEINANFNAVANEVNDNAVRLSTVESNVSGGNIVLSPSTVAEGNILKGADSFIHDFGTDNTFIGSKAGNFAMTGYENVGSGVEVLRLNTTGRYNTAAGAFSLSANTTGNNNTANGASALQRNTTGNFNTATGAFALFDNTTGSNNTASGDGALSSNTTGSGNTANGARALDANTVGNFNTASGLGALATNTAGEFNTASGANALFNNTTGGQNTAIGVSALLDNTTGNGNTAIGLSALVNNTTGNSNTAIGGAALQKVTTGIANIAIGNSAGVNLTTGDNNIAIGNPGVTSEADTIRIGNAQTRAFIAGISGATSSGGTQVFVNAVGQLGTSTSSRRFKEDISDMGEASAALVRLRPVTFRYKLMYDDGSRLLQYGLIAEEVASVYPGLVVTDPDGKAQAVRYHFLAPMLLNEYQKQQRTIEAQRARVHMLERRLARLEAVLAAVGRPSTAGVTSLQGVLSPPSRAAARLPVGTSGSDRTGPGEF